MEDVVLKLLKDLGVTVTPEMIKKSEKAKEFVDSLFNESEKELTTKVASNISYDKDKTLFVEVNVAGYPKENLEIDIEDGLLIVTGHPTDSAEELLTYTRKTIITDGFTAKFRLSREYLNGEILAEVSDGILLIVIKPTVKHKNKIEIL